MAIVTAQGLTKRWGDNDVLVDTSFEIGAGVTGLLGSNGSGKTTLFGMFLGLHSPSRGTLRVLDLDPLHQGAEIRQRLGYSPEHEALPADMTAYDFVRHVAELHGLPRRAAAGRASDALYEVGLGEERARACGTMSTGQKQRVKLAQAIVHDPHLVLLDEPTNGLDPVQRDEMLDLIHRCGHELGLSVIVSSHLLDEIERTCDRVVIVANKVVTNGGELGRRSGVEEAVPLVLDLDVDATVADAFAQQLRGVGLEVLIEPLRPTVLVIAPPAELAPREVRRRLLDLAVQNDVPIRSMKRHVRSLEDLFFEATAEPTP
jgi:ABC-2 type transport system ATP-binding protein